MCALLPEVLCRRCHFEEREFCMEHLTEKRSAYISTGKWFTSFIAVSGVALPIVLHRVELISGLAFWLSFSGMVVFVVSFIVFVQAFYVKDGGDDDD